MHTLPHPEEQEWLIEALAGLVARCGPAPLVAKPLVQPTSEYFPDPWSFSQRGLDRVARRLMQYAGLGELEIQLDVFTDDEWYLRTKGASRGGVAGLFFGIENGTCFFGFNADAPADEEYMAGVMAHEVAHAYRTHLGIPPAKDRDEEELLTDVTSVFLGFGILTANNSHRYRSSDDGGGAYAVHRWSTHRAGYLPPQAFAYLLALQARARGLRERKQTIGHLENNQAAFFKAALDATEPWKDRLPERLGLAGIVLEPEEHAVEAILLPLPEMEEEAGPSPDLYNEGEVVFRLRKNHPIAAAFFGIVFGLLPAALLGFLSSSWTQGVFQKVAAVTVPVGFVFMMLRERRGRRDFCSDSDCPAALPPEAETCPNCGGTIAGVIGARSERHAARERYEAAQGKTETPAAENQRGRREKTVTKRSKKSSGERSRR